MKVFLNRRDFCAGAAALSLTGLSSTGNARADEVVKVGWPNETEQAILGCMAALILERKLGLKVQRIANLGGTGIAQQALMSGAIDVLPDYTGAWLANVLKLPPISDPKNAYETVRDNCEAKYQLTWLAPTSFNNSYALALKSAKAKELNIKRISDLKQTAATSTLGSSVEFAARPLDGYAGFVKRYGFKFGTLKPMDVGLMYSAIANGAVDLIVAYATDARVAKLNLTVLDDDKLFFPAYNAAFTVRDDIMHRHPEFRGAIEAVTTTLDAATQTRLNGRADIDGIDCEQVAETYLKEKKFIA
ncbi:MAG: Substrate-binding region of ABC-type glycine betaine transport system [Gammaproteobacteria bacterium]|nr:Substrate-binding region of ABC-type glycine betaine transport system [Gammaproteobacteria bacterium]